MEDLPLVLGEVRMRLCDHGPEEHDVEDHPKEERPPTASNTVVSYVIARSQCENVHSLRDACHVWCLTVLNRWKSVVPVQRGAGKDRRSG